MSDKAIYIYIYMNKTYSPLYRIHMIKSIINFGGFIFSERANSPLGNFDKLSGDCLLFVILYFRISGL